MELQTSKVDLLLDVDQKPDLVPGLFLSLQHVFAMFGATVLVPLILGMPVSVALFASGLGTLIYMVATQFKATDTGIPNINGTKTVAPNIANTCCKLKSSPGTSSGF